MVLHMLLAMQTERRKREPKTNPKSRAEFSTTTMLKTQPTWAQASNRTQQSQRIKWNEQIKNQKNGTTENTTKFSVRMHNLEIWISHSDYSCFFSVWFGTFERNHVATLCVPLLIVSSLFRCCLYAALSHTQRAIVCWIYLPTQHTPESLLHGKRSLLRFAIVEMPLTALSFVIRSSRSLQKPTAHMPIRFGQHKLSLNFSLVYCITNSHIPHEIAHIA